MSDKRLGNNPLDWIGSEPQEKPKEKQRTGRPRTIKREYTKSSQEGLKENWTRYTVIVREDLLERLKDHVYYEETTMKAVINHMIESYLDDKENERNE